VNVASLEAGGGIVVDGTSIRKEREYIYNDITIKMM
jgi:hypothetical protein